jgi:hypothetical protein
MIINLKCPEIAYFIGVVQTDGSFSVYNVKKYNKIYKRADFGIQGSIASLPMIVNFCRILDKYFDRRISISKVSRGMYDAHTSINTLLSLFKKLEILPRRLSVPSWTRNDVKLFGSYLAGLIDGDGDVRVKRPKYPQYAIRISSEENPHALREIIAKFFKCGVHFKRYKKRGIFPDGRIVIGHCYELEFYITYKNILNIKRYILPYITIKHKKELIKKAIQANMPW